MTDRKNGRCEWPVYRVVLFRGTRVIEPMDAGGKINLGMIVESFTITVWSHSVNGPSDDAFATKHRCRAGKKFDLGEGGVYGKPDNYQTDFEKVTFAKQKKKNLQNWWRCYKSRARTYIKKVHVKLITSFFSWIQLKNNTFGHNFMQLALLAASYLIPFASRHFWF